MRFKAARNNFNTRLGMQSLDVHWQMDVIRSSSSTYCTPIGIATQHHRAQLPAGTASRASIAKKTSDTQASSRAPSDIAQSVQQSGSPRRPRARDDIQYEP